MLLPTTCAGCATPGPVCCAPCRRGLVPAGEVSPPWGLDAAWAAFVHDDVAARLVTGLKYDRRRRLIPILAVELAAVVGEEPDLVTWAPTTRAHRRQRGFDQSELLARAVARRLDRPVRRLLRRADERSQTGRSGAERRGNVCFAPIRPSPPTVLVVDDVLTTGATLAAAAEAVRRAGAQRVVALTVTFRPPPGHLDERPSSPGVLCPTIP